MMDLARPGLVALLFATLLIGCASGATPRSGPARQMDLITRAEVVEVGAGSAHDVVQRLRPHMLQTRAGGELVIPQVFVDGVERGSVSVLQAIPAANVESIRFVARDRQSTLSGSSRVAVIYLTTVRP